MTAPRNARLLIETIIYSRYQLALSFVVFLVGALIL